MTFLYLAAAVCATVILVGWLLMIIGHAANVRECAARGHLWQQDISITGKDFMFCIRCGRSA